nr:MAG TPA: hypothetical protein [Bacteriophage sp.]
MSPKVVLRGVAVHLVALASNKFILNFNNSS